MRKPSEVKKILKGLKEIAPEPRCALHHESAFQLLAATILSAQCTDERVNIVTVDLFRRWPTPEKLSRCRPETLEAVIHSTGFFRNKAKSLRGMARMLVADYRGEVPETIEELIRLPGVARKTANVVLGTWFRKASGVVVDTHVGRISARLGLTKEKDPVKIERDLMSQIPKAEWIDFSHRMVLHGRGLCKARKADCKPCPLAPVCPKTGVTR